MKDIINNTQVLNSCFDNYINNLYNNKIKERNYPIMYIYKNKKMFFILIYIPKILKVNQDISHCFAVIKQDNNNNNILFYL